MANTRTLRLTVGNTGDSTGDHTRSSARAHSRVTTRTTTRGMARPTTATAATAAITRALAASALLGALGAAGGAQAAGNLFTNGSFESPNTPYLELAGGDTTITGWTTVLSGVELFAPSAYGLGSAADGLMAVDLANYVYSSGGLEQTVATEVGRRYDVAFMAGNSLSSGRDGTGIVQVSIDGGASMGFTTAVATTAAMAWAPRSFSFFATGTSTTVRFWNDQNPHLHFAVIDGVGMAAAVPEPGAALLLVAGVAVLGLRMRRRA